MPRSYYYRVLLHTISDPPIERADVEEANKLARLPVGQQQGRRRALLARLKRKGISMKFLQQFLRLSHADLVGEVGQGNPNQGP